MLPPTPSREKSSARRTIPAGNPLSTALIESEQKRTLEVPQTRGSYHATRGIRPRVSAFFALLQESVIRDFKGRYRRSVLGPGWAVLQPAFYMLVFLFLRGVLDIPSDGSPYVIFTYAALVPWTFFSNALTRAAGSVYGGAGILKKSPVQREIFPLSAVLSALVDFAIAAAILALLMVWYRVAVGWALLWLPVLIVLVVLLSLGTGMGIAAIGTFRRDVLFGINFVMQFWMLGSPVMYPMSQVPEKWRTLYELNPMVGIIEGFRAVVVRNESPDLFLLGSATVVIAVIWIVAWPTFRFASSYFADVL